jgi:hypothetical protein
MGRVGGVMLGTLEHCWGEGTGSERISERVCGKGPLIMVILGRRDRSEWRKNGTRRCGSVMLFVGVD